MTIKERRRIKKFYKNNTSYPAAVHDNNKDFMHKKTSKVKISNNPEEVNSGKECLIFT